MADLFFTSLASQLGNVVKVVNLSGMVSNLTTPRVI